MIIVSKIIATCFGIGYIQKGAGTVAALFCCITWWLLGVHQANAFHQSLYITVLFFLGVMISTIAETLWGHDSNKVVIDEWMGMAVTLFLVPFSWLNFAIAFVLFRVFDIAKPLFIKKAEGFAGGWGVMLDDLLAGIYSLLILQVLLKTGIL